MRLSLSPIPSATCGGSIWSSSRQGVAGGVLGGSRYLHRATGTRRDPSGTPPWIRSDIRTRQHRCPVEMAGSAAFGRPPASTAMSTSGILRSGRAGATAIRRKANATCRAGTTLQNAVRCCVDIPPPRSETSTAKQVLCSRRTERCYSTHISVRRIAAAIRFARAPGGPPAFPPSPSPPRRDGPKIQRPMSPS